MTPLLPVAALLAGCGYALVRYGDGPGDVRSVAVRTLANRSSEPGYELAVTEALLREFLRRGALDVMRRPEEADVIVSGSVGSIHTRARTFSSIVLALEYEVTVLLELEILRRGGREIEVPESTLMASELYTASSDLEAQRKNREEALRRVAAVLANRVHDSISERFPE